MIWFVVYQADRIARMAYSMHYEEFWIWVYLGIKLGNLGSGSKGRLDHVGALYPCACFRILEYKIYVDYTLIRLS